ncbi:helix-turn-helix transcriptional regulator [Paenibacillus sp. XY044]|uniref:ArsR/SmtB family transcription factor n=1 Tax=Paenibacillus sp. XY044 TaxID=2026089 RepID=UPI000B97D184|nr:metalloregulator ArsR/SmtB family transcription factor [Paenibacillus sp. XY044]OZB95317.1 transcriptional regulator [Paenibacillus sp. XY044]
MNRETAAQIAVEFKNNQKVLVAIGNGTQQAILQTLIQGPQTPGMRVGEIRLRTHLSRPAVSHHLKILKDAQIVSVHKQGTINYYRLDSKSKLKSLKDLVHVIEKALLPCE